MKEDWIESTLGEILVIERGGSPRPIKEFITNDENGVNWIKIADATKSGKYILKTIQKIKPSGLKRSREVFPGDLLLSNSMSFGRPYIMGIKGAIHDGWLVIRDNKYLDKDYLYYALGSPTTFNQFSKKAKGSTVKNLNIVIVSDVTIKVNPLLIQKAIVKKIEELFSSLDSGIADLKKAQDQLVIYRQAVLKKAFEGDFKEVNLQDACEKIIKVKRKEMDLNKPLLYLDIGGIDNKTNVIFSHKEYTWENAPSRAQQIIKVGDVLFSTVRTYLKNIAQINNPIYNDEIASSGFTVIRGKKDLLNPKFIFFIATSQFFLEPLNKLQRGTSYPAVRDKDVFSQLIPLPTLMVQQLIVKEIESRLSVCDKVEESIKESLQKAIALRQSILKRAFEGKLLSEVEIAKCKLDKDYEPASVLLEKIRAEKKKK